MLQFKSYSIEIKVLQLLLFNFVYQQSRIILLVIECRFCSRCYLVLRSPNIFVSCVIVLLDERCKGQTYNFCFFFVMQFVQMCIQNKELILQQFDGIGIVCKYAICMSAFLGRGLKAGGLDLSSSFFIFYFLGKLGFYVLGGVIVR
eukprot:TRINITY_DN5378_c2_g1_i1.p5 TRINITY_DN5378_c2_g1~~TRINITY_DN5378_c2_g1_i1.p5  ORF type:complete len:146 (+),score=0.09 TRINITY_DN5378_c2_g1_i1:866-1303(+)